MISKLLDEPYWDEVDRILARSMGERFLVTNLKGTPSGVIMTILWGITDPKPWTLIEKQNHYVQAMPAGVISQYLKENLKEVKAAVINYFYNNLYVSRMPHDVIDNAKKILETETNINKLFLCFKDSPRHNLGMKLSLKKHFNIEVN